MEFNWIDVAHFCSGLYSLILILVGTPLNLLCFYIFTRLVPNRNNPTIIVFAYLALIELLIPFTWNINYVVRELVWKFQRNNSLKNVEQYSLIICKLISFGAYFSLQCAAWLKTLATFARCVTLNHQWTLNKWISKPTIIRKICWILIVLVALINGPIWFIKSEKTFSLDASNQTIVRRKCYQSEFFRFWEIVHLLAYNFLPFTLMILSNIFLVRQVQSSRQRMKQSRSSSARQRRPKTSSTGGRLTTTLILVTIFFIVFTAPAAIFYIFFDKKIQHHRNLISMSLSNLATTSHVMSFLIYWLTSSDFQDAAIALFCCRSTIPKRTNTDERQKSDRSNPQQQQLPLINADEKI